MTTDYKTWLQSKTIWGLLIVAAPILSQMFHHDIGQGLNDTLQIADGAGKIVNNVMELFGLVMAAYGRITATKQLWTPAKAN